MRSSRVISTWLGAGALACLAACGSSGSTAGPGSLAGIGGAGGRGGNGQTAAGLDAGSAVDGPPGAASLRSCPGPGDDAGVTCVQFDPGYAAVAALCAGRADGGIVNAPCPSDGAAGGCHVAGPTGGYTIWWYAPLTPGAVLTRCEQLGDSYVSPTFDMTADASAHAIQPNGS